MGPAISDLSAVMIKPVLWFPSRARESSLQHTRCDSSSLIDPSLTSGWASWAAGPHRQAPKMVAGVYGDLDNAIWAEGPDILLIQDDPSIIGKLAPRLKYPMFSKKICRHPIQFHGVQKALDFGCGLAEFCNCFPGLMGNAGVKPMEDLRTNNRKVGWINQWELNLDKPKLEYIEPTKKDKQIS